jgi:1,4-alpha-glucan branching enzyme
MALDKQFLKSRSVCKVRFTISAEEASGATHACIVGEFNEWDPAAGLMKLQKDGSLTAVLEIPVGREYRFRYFVDHCRWLNDSHADGYEYCPFSGCDNSLLNI